MKISAIVLTKNEEKNLPQCLACLSFCPEIILIDDFSSDKTEEIAKILGAKVFKHDLDNDFAGQRNFGLSKASGDWIIFIDADERVSPALRQEIETVVNHTPQNYRAFNIKRRDFTWGKKILHGECGNIKFIRLARRSAGRWHRRVHEYWNIIGPVGEMKNELLHYPHPSLKEFIAHINFMSTLHAQAGYEEGKRSNVGKIIFWPSGKFIVNYVFKLGFLDGVEGMVIALMMSLHSFLAWSKLWKMEFVKR